VSSWKKKSRHPGSPGRKREGSSGSFLHVEASWRAVSIPQKGTVLHPAYRLAGYFLSYSSPFQGAQRLVLEKVTENLVAAQEKLHVKEASTALSAGKPLTLEYEFLFIQNNG
jgi:hypothetical protein